MGIKQLETGILAEARIVTNNKKLRQKDIMEWSTGDVKVEEGEVKYYLPELGINIAIKTETETKTETKNRKEN